MKPGGFYNKHSNTDLTLMDLYSRERQGGIKWPYKSNKPIRAMKKSRMLWKCITVGSVLTWWVGEGFQREWHLSWDVKNEVSRWGGTISRENESRFKDPGFGHRQGPFRRRKWQLTQVHAWEIPWTEEAAGSQRVGHDWACTCRHGRFKNRKTV